MPSQEDAESLTGPQWVKIHDHNELEQFYLSRLPAIRQAAKQLGYAIGVHGSCRRDFDLIAVAWQDHASTPDELAHAVALAACQMTRNGTYNWELKPAGRIATSIPICWPLWYGQPGAGHIDLSVVIPNRPNPPKDTRIMQTTKFDKFNRIAEYCSDIIELAPDLIYKRCAQMFDINCRINHAFNSTPLKAWEDAEEWEITSTLYSLLFNRICQDAPPSAEHERWLKERESQGWSYGPVRDDKLKHNPNMVPYKNLPVYQQAKDIFFQEISRRGLELPVLYREYDITELSEVYQLLGELDNDQTLIKLVNTPYFFRRLWTSHRRAQILINISNKADGLLSE